MRLYLLFLVLIGVFVGIQVWMTGMQHSETIETSLPNALAHFMTLSSNDHHSNNNAITINNNNSNNNSINRHNNKNNSIHNHNNDPSQNVTFAQNIRFFTTYREHIDPEDLWEQHSDRHHLPPWMKGYLRWHKHTMQQLTIDNWHEQRYIVAACTKYMRQCGGTADRLWPLPFYLRVAAQSKRIFLTKWGRPAELEDFLLPPLHGFDWRVPEWLFPLVSQTRRKTGVKPVILDFANRDDLVSFYVKIQADGYGSDYYDALKDDDEPTFYQVQRSLWEIAYTPSEPLKQRVETFMKENRLIPNYYGATHVRALHGVIDRAAKVVRNWSHIAMNCTTQQLQAKGPIYYASDSGYGPAVAQQYGQDYQTHVVTRNVTQDAVHMDKKSDWRQTDREEFFDIFVDLLVMSKSRCVAYNVGGFGKLAATLSYNPQCSIQHGSRHWKAECQFQDGPELVPPSEQPPSPIFLPAMSPQQQQQQQQE